MFRSDPRVQAALFTGTLTLYIATATPGAFWLDSSELAAAGVTLGIPHAPGHPLYLILAHAASLVPVGSIGFRLAMLSALCGALAVTLVYALTMRLAAVTLDARPPDWAAALPAVAFALSEALWLQSVRAEVYTLHLLIALGLLVVAIDWTLSKDRRPGPLWSAAFLLGLGGGNHHLLLLALMPAVAVLLLADTARRSAVRRALPGATLAAMTGPRPSTASISSIEAASSPSRSPKAAATTSATVVPTCGIRRP
ncbi:MAG: DUF2723 domain-containing protein, partial [Myxococcota bacterium]|nr:DUF2723 domain-containing protein [Myxococcota bacterium]